jgi:hypothetical protein
MTNPSCFRNFVFRLVLAVLGAALLSLSFPSHSFAASNEKTIYDFCSRSSCSDGMNPASGLMVDQDFIFYGTAEYGGKHNGGVAFQACAKRRQNQVDVLRHSQFLRVQELFGWSPSHQRTDYRFRGQPLWHHIHRWNDNRPLGRGVQIDAWRERLDT